MPPAWSALDRRARALGVLLTVAPLAVELVPALGPRRDVRMLWMALAATLTAPLVVRLVAARFGRATVVVAALVTATAVATAVAFLLGARAGPGAVMVALVLSALATAGAVLGASSRSAST